MKKVHCLLLFLLPFMFAFTTSSESANDSSCPAPTTVQVTGQTSNSVSFSWVSSGSGSVVKYYRHEDKYSSPVSSIASTSSHTFSNLSAGTYDFYIASDCGSGDVSSYVIIEDMVM